MAADQDQTINIEVDGRSLTARPGAMLIEVTDEAGISVPRFCYHKKLSIAANCRMCLVEVANVPKPLPACATPVADGMKVFTRSPLAIAAQKGTMEFLLINHPLDCPICDQGGECELQDVAMGYGSDLSRFVEGKRVVADKDIGPLIATDMTRCIHCTRCVRFGTEIAGIRELGATGRGEHMQIGTFIERSVDSEISGNVIDLCPVGALTAKPSRYQARAWEMVQREAIAPHDAVGSNLYLHLRDGRVMRVVPRDNEAINETWISDRDRFSYQGLYSADRLRTPLIKTRGKWQEADWDTALRFAADGLKRVRDEHGASELGALCSPRSTLEELFLSQKLMRGLGSTNIDHRLRQADFRDQARDPVYPWLGLPISELEKQNAVLLIGSNLRKEQPILAHRLRKAGLRGAAIMVANPIRYDFPFPMAEQLISAPSVMVGELSAVAKALGVDSKPLKPLLKGVKVKDRHETVARVLKQAESGCVLLGGIATAHPDFALLRALADAIAKAGGCRMGVIAEAANSVGAVLAGALPHRLPGGSAAEPVGLDLRAMLDKPRKGYLLLDVEPAHDLWNPALGEAAFGQAEFVVALSAYRAPSLEMAADVILPIAAFPETSGTYVNAAGDWQSFAGAAPPPGEARPGWKVLRVLANLMDVEGFEQVSSEEVLTEVRAAVGDLTPDNVLSGEPVTEIAFGASELERVGDVSIYGSDAIVRRARALQATADARAAMGIRVNPEVASKAGLNGSGLATVDQDQRRVTLPVSLDTRVPDGCVWIPAGVTGNDGLGGQFGAVSLEPAPQSEPARE